MSDNDIQKFTVATAAPYLGVSEKFIRARIADGTLKAYRLRGSQLIRINRDDLDALMRPVVGA